MKKPSEIKSGRYHPKAVERRRQKVNRYVRAYNAAFEKYGLGIKEHGK